jgi:hypothetical protein
VWKSSSPRSNQKFQYEPITGAWIAHVRGRVERRIGLFAAQFNAGTTLNRKAAHLARGACARRRPTTRRVT